MMMMTRAAGGANLSAILDHRSSDASSRRIWAIVLTTAIVGHVAGGVFLMRQKFELAPVAETDTVPPTIIELYRPELEKPKPVLSPEPPASAPKLNRPEQIFESKVPPLAVPESPVTSTNASPVINLTTPVTTTAPGTATAPVEAPPVRQQVITQPDWVQRPTAEQLMTAYPERAIDAGVHGQATLNCAVKVDGTLTGCRIESETPARYGFGRAAMSLSRHFRMSPRTVDGQAVEGARVTVGLRFNVAD